METAERFIQKLRIPFVTGSLGGVETLISRPAVVSHSGMSPEERAQVGVTDDLIRLSVGLEATSELIEDLGQALA